jgi:hypothetical protein
VRYLPLLLALGAVVAACGRTPLDIDETPPPTEAGAADAGGDATDADGAETCAVPAQCHVEPSFSCPLGLHGVILECYANPVAYAMALRERSCKLVGTPIEGVGPMLWCCPCGM